DARQPADPGQARRGRARDGDALPALRMGALGGARDLRRRDLYGLPRRRARPALQRGDGLRQAYGLHRGQGPYCLPLLRARRRKLHGLVDGRDHGDPGVRRDGAAHGRPRGRGGHSRQQVGQGEDERPEHRRVYPASGSSQRRRLARGGLHFGLVGDVRRRDPDDPLRLVLPAGHPPHPRHHLEAGSAPL
ncbi:MAG: CDP-diacylglycerol--glycerol-3-phosphate 3-phosphatidyltransferase, partial [uncultured Rubrobacteraceae bacterium]